MKCFVLLGTADSLPRVWAGSKGPQHFASSTSDKRQDAEKQLGQEGSVLHSSPPDAGIHHSSLKFPACFASSTLGCPRIAAAPLQALTSTGRDAGGAALLCKSLDAL